MFTPNRLLRLSIEFIFVLLGALLMWLGLTGKIFVDRYSVGWLGLSIAMLLWGARAMVKPGQRWAPGERWVRGLSLLLLGGVMLVISRVPFRFVGPLLGAAGLLLVLRGVAGAALALRSR
ncbi:MAG: hypothetical protein PVS2B2_13790 [Candidatus Acidiferrum sp.]